MKSARWGKASQDNTANPTPLYPFPSAYDIRLHLDNPNQTAYVGPVVPRQPAGQRNYDNVNITWEGAAPVNTVVARDDFASDHTSDAAWWTATSNFAHVANGQQDFSDAQAMAIFTKAPKAVNQIVVAKFRIVPGSHPGISGVVPAFSVQDSWSDLFSLGLYWQDVGGACWMQGSGINVVSDVFYLETDTDYWLRSRSSFIDPDQADISCAVFTSDPAQTDEPLFRHVGYVSGVAKLATPAYTGLHMIGPEVLLDEYRVEVFGEASSSTVKNFDFQSRINHRYSGAPKWRTITIQWCMGALVLATTTHEIFI